MAILTSKYTCTASFFAVHTIFRCLFVAGFDGISSSMSSQYSEEHGPLQSYHNTSPLHIAPAHAPCYVMRHEKCDANQKRPAPG